MPFKLDPEYNAILKSLFGNRPTPAPLPVGDVEARRARMEPGIATPANVLLRNKPRNKVSIDRARLR